MISARLSRLVRAFYDAHEKTPIVTEALSALTDGRFEDLVRLRADPRSYSDADSYFNDAKVVGFLSKFEGEIDGLDRVKAAKDNWWKAEKQNYWTNQRLLPYVPLNFPGFRAGLESAVPDIESFFVSVRELVESWIGTAPPSLVDGKYGPGGTLSVPGKLATVPDKVSSVPTLTPGAMGWLFQWSSTLWARDALATGRQIDFVRGNRFATAPKKATVDRGIGIEPDINVYYQLGLGRTLRNRLKKSTRWDLDTAQTVHRRLAEESSVSLRFATADLTNASESVCRNLVRATTPRSWVSALESLRSPTTEVDGKTVYLEKFSSMGNGYTFELETIIFAALCAVSMRRIGLKGVLGTDLFVFGDDIIVPEEAYRTVTAVLNFCGLTLNQEKSFSGPIPFRESCGADFFGGRAVRPLFLKKEPDDLPRKISLVNGIGRVLEDSLKAGKPEALRVWRRALDNVPREFQLFGPSWLGDTVVHAENREHWSTRVDQWGTAHIRIVCTLGAFTPWKYWRPDVKLASLVYGSGDPKRGVIPRHPETTYVSEWVPLLQNKWLPTPVVRHGPEPSASPYVRTMYCFVQKRDGRRKVVRQV